MWVSQLFFSKLYVAGADGWGGCSIFQSKLVKGEGWCSAWTPV